MAIITHHPAPRLANRGISRTVWPYPDGQPTERGTFSKNPVIFGTDGCITPGEIRQSLPENN